MTAKYPGHVERAMRLTFDALNERQRRLYAATESPQLGHGGMAYLRRLFDGARKAIASGLDDLRQPALPPHRARQKGGGRKRRLNLFPGLDDAVLEIVAPFTAGEPDTDGVLWAKLSRPRIVQELSRRGRSAARTPSGRSPAGRAGTSNWRWPPSPARRRTRSPKKAPELTGRRSHQGFQERSERMRPGREHRRFSLREKSGFPPWGPSAVRGRPRLFAERKALECGSGTPRGGRPVPAA